MDYYFSTILSRPFDEAVDAVTDALKAQGFGVLTTIDVKETLHRKLGVDFPRYTILGACNPRLAYEALQKEARIGTMLPCNVIVRELDDGRVEVAAVDPVVSMYAVQNPDLGVIAGKVRSMLEGSSERSRAMGQLRLAPQVLDQRCDRENDQDENKQAEEPHAPAHTHAIETLHHDGPPVRQTPWRSALSATLSRSSQAP